VDSRSGWLQFRPGPTCPQAFSSAHRRIAEYAIERVAAHFHRAAAEFSALRARFHSAEGLHDPDLDRRHDVAVYLQILEDWVYEGIKWQLLDTDRYGTTIHSPTRRTRTNS